MCVLGLTIELLSSDFCTRFDFWSPAFPPVLPQKVCSTTSFDQWRAERSTIHPFCTHTHIDVTNIHTSTHTHTHTRTHARKRTNKRTYTHTRSCTVACGRRVNIHHCGLRVNVHVGAVNSRRRRCTECPHFRFGLSSSPSTASVLYTHVRNS